MTTFTSNLAVVFCHGSYHTSAPYGPLLGAFNSKGISANCPGLPTADFTKLDIGGVNTPQFDRRPPPGGKKMLRPCWKSSSS